MTSANQSYQSNARSRNMRAAGIGVIIVAICVALFGSMYPKGAGAQTAPGLGGASSFAVLGGSTVTNTDTPTIVYGNLGVSPGTAVTGFPPGVVNGVIHSNTAAAQDAQSGVTAAYGVLDQPCTENLTGQDLGNRTLTAGVYCFETSAGMTGTLTLDGQGSSDAVFIFKIGSTLTTASGSSVNLIGSANACNVFWRVGSSATLGTTTDFAGNILAQASITLNTGATIIGRALARDGGVTMDNNVVDARPCGAQAPTATPTATPAGVGTPTATPVGVGTPTATPVGDGTPTATPVGDGTPTATPVGDGTPTATPAGDGTPTATPVVEGTPTATPVGEGTPTATPVVEGTPTATPVGERTPTAPTSTATLTAPGAPSTGSGTGGATPMSLLAVGTVLLLMGGSAAVALSARRRA